jgi:transcriptional regulator
MYTPPHFEVNDPAEIHAAIRACGLAHFVTAGADGISATPLPFFLEASEGEYGTLYGHLARANSQWKQQPTSDALVIFVGPDAYISPTWYATKAETHKVVPTWNYGIVHAYGPVEFFNDPERLLDVVTRLTNIHEGKRANPWKVTDAPADFIQGQLRGIVGIRIPITRLEGKLKMNQNRTEADRAGVVKGLSESERAMDREAAQLVPLKRD